MQLLLPPLSAFVAVTLIGTIGFYVLEGSNRGSRWTLVDALYQAVITVTTVGLTEAHELDQRGRLFTSVLAVFGVAVFTFLATSIAQYLITGELQGIWARRRMDQKIAQLKGHFIICGFGRMGWQVAADLQREKHPVVVIDKAPESLQQAVDIGCLVIDGNAGDDNALLHAGIERARCLLAVIDDDATNVMVTLSARALNEKLFIIARSNIEATEPKLIAAGANRVLSPYGISGRRMAQMALRPNVVEFLEVVTHDRELELWLEEITVALGAVLDGREIGASAIRGRTGANIVAIRTRADKMLVSPPADTRVQAGDILIALGTRAHLTELRKLACESQPGT